MRIGFERLRQGGLKRPQLARHGFLAVARQAPSGALSHFLTVVRDSPVRRAISERDSPSRSCILLTLPNISMVITSFPPPQNGAGRLNTLVGFWPAKTVVALMTDIEAHVHGLDRAGVDQ